MKKRPHVTLHIKAEDGASLQSKGEARHDVAMAAYLLLSGNAGNAPGTPHISRLNSAIRTFLDAVRKYETDTILIRSGILLEEYQGRAECPGCWNCNEYIGKAALYAGFGYRYKVPVREHHFGPYEEKLNIPQPCDGSGLLPCVYSVADLNKESDC